MNCLICNSNNLQIIDTIISDFVMARIAPNIKDNFKTKLCFCKNCSFAFYDYRLNEDEVEKLYYHYRDDEYQKLREQSEYWYTKKINNLINTDVCALEEQKRIIRKIIKDNCIDNIETALDYGGNEGRTFFDELGTKKKYVFDISRVKTVEGVENISNYDDLKKHSYSFIMCNMLFEHLSDPVSVMKKLSTIGGNDTVYYIEVPSENPFLKGNKFSISKHLELAFNPNYNLFKLIKYYLKTKKEPFMPMKEHINFFTVKSMKKMIELNGFKVIDIQENSEKGVLGNTLVLSALFKKSK